MTSGMKSHVYIHILSNAAHVVMLLILFAQISKCLESSHFLHKKKDLISIILCLYVRIKIIFYRLIFVCLSLQGSTWNSERLTEPLGFVPASCSHSVRGQKSNQMKLNTQPWT